jgi:hypothetical protein
MNMELLPQQNKYFKYSPRHLEVLAKNLAEKISNNLGEELRYYFEIAYTGQRNFSFFAYKRIEIIKKALEGSDNIYKRTILSLLEELEKIIIAYANKLSLSKFIIPEARSKYDYQKGEEIIVFVRKPGHNIYTIAKAKIDEFETFKEGNINVITIKVKYKNSKKLEKQGYYLPKIIRLDSYLWWPEKEIIELAHTNPKIKEIFFNTLYYLIKLNAYYATSREDMELLNLKMNILYQLEKIIIPKLKRKHK